ncbi:hypothetical protein [Aquimarina pacifica]|uniref:hypothetical protein n=1 Tax=Aquimarina pacifica TaxID=1296415 RepID=UPI0004716502|nr:hypothetical protein [Aquimarina pacifica]
MLRTLLFLSFIFILGCARTVEPSVDNINRIFASKDFTFEFNRLNGKKESLSFRSDFLVYKSDKPTYRREVSYDEVLLINDYIKKILSLHSNTLDPNTSSYYVIENTAYKVIITPNLEDLYFDALILTLKLK